MLLIQNKILLSYFNNNSNLTSLIKYSYLNIKVLKNDIFYVIIHIF